MIYEMDLFKLKIIISILFLGSFQFVSSQKLSTELNSKLSISDQKKLQKADEVYTRGKTIESNINPASKDEKKSQLKWLEAAADYQEANATRNKVYTSNIKDFWKKYKGEKNLLDFSKKIEIAAADSFKAAQQIRSAADKERRMGERVRLLTSAEKMESRSLVMMQKALFSYLSWPVEFDHVWVSSTDQEVPRPAKNSKTEVTEKKSIKDTVKTKETVGSPLLTPSNTKAKDTIPVKNPENKTIIGNKPVKKTSEVSGNDSSLYGKVNISEDQVDKFNSFLQKRYPDKYEDYVINFQNLDYSDVNALKEAWYKYQFGYATSDTAALMLAANQDTSSKQQNLAQEYTAKTTETGKISRLAKTGKNSKNGTEKVNGTQTDVALNTRNNSNTGVKNKSGKTVVTNKANQASGYNNLKPEISDETTEFASGFTFRVQIAACRVSLDEKTIKGIYSGSLNVIELSEDNWNKYAIGQFNSYKAARQLRDQSNIPGAFVIAYLKGKRIKITPGIAYKRFVSTIKAENLNPALVSYRIQIISSKVVLSDDHIKNIYNGPLKVMKLREDGWNKYYLYAGKTFVEAKNLLNQISIPGAFILAYYQHTRIEVSTATKLTK